MSGHQIAFLLVGAFLVVSALLVVSLRNIVHAALSLAMCFAGVAGIYVLLQAEFLAAAQVLIYIGAITVLVLFAIMLTRQIMGRELPALTSQWPLGLVGAGSVLGLLLHLVFRGPWAQVETTQPPYDSTVAMGWALMRDYVLPFELASVILLAALVGAVLLAKNEGPRR